MPSTLVKSFGEIFGNCLLEAIADPNCHGQLRWLAKQPGENHAICQSPGVTQGDHQRTYQPLDDVDPSVLRAVRFPLPPIPYGGTRELFESICKIIGENTSLTKLQTLLMAFSALATWLPERSDVPVCVAIIGPPSAERRRLVRVLQCLFRRPLHLADCNLSSLQSLPRTLNPSLFIEYWDSLSQLRKILQATSLRDAHVISHGRPIDTHCAKVVCLDEPWKASFADWPALEICVPPADGRLPIFDDRAEEQIAQKFQGMLMMYRLQNYNEAPGLPLDLPELTPHSRELLRSVSQSLIVDSELQETLLEALRTYDSEFDKPCEDLVQSATVQALLELCHRSQTTVHVQEITERLNRILEPRGELLPLKERSVAPRVRKLGFDTHERDRSGFFVRLLQSTRIRIHKLAKDHNVLARNVDLLCTDCKEFRPFDEQIDREEELIKAIGL
jgi:hypothetical protein